jgi:phosphoribosyl-ATP pyrophosphohydrolase
MPDFTLEDLAGIVAERAGSRDPASYTATLAGAGLPGCARKFGEEAVELVIAAAAGEPDAIRAEAADVLYHILVLLHVAGVPFAEVKAQLQRRTAQTGLEEKAGRAAR